VGGGDLRGGGGGGGVDGEAEVGPGGLELANRVGVERGDSRKTIARSEGEEGVDERSGSGDAHQGVGEPGLGGGDAAQQRAPGEVEGDQVGRAVELGRQRLGGGDHEDGVGQAALAGRAGGATRGLGHA
jgi:hypothetical protein